MKYIMLVYSDEDCWTEDERMRCMAESVQYCHELAAAGKYIAASPLQYVSTATSIRVRDGKPLITDGPFAETVEQLGGYFLVDAENLDEAISIASRIPSAPKSTIEIRPIVDLDNLPKPH